MDINIGDTVTLRDLGDGNNVYEFNGKVVGVITKKKITDIILEIPDKDYENRSVKDSETTNIDKFIIVDDNQKYYQISPHTINYYQRSLKSLLQSIKDNLRDQRDLAKYELKNYYKKLNELKEEYKYAKDRLDDIKRDIKEGEHFCKTAKKEVWKEALIELVEKGFSPVSIISQSLSPYEYKSFKNKNVIQKLDRYIDAKFDLTMAKADLKQAKKELEEYIKRNKEFLKELNKDASINLNKVSTNAIQDSEYFTFMKLDPESI